MKICSVALAYPRLELDFIAEWVDYHLAIGVDQIFLGLHVNEENVAREHLIPPKRPYPRMYHLEGSEGDILSEFYHRIEPFRARVKTFLFRRDDNRYHLHCEQQKELYQLVLDQHRNDFDWVAAHDIDEFIVPVRKPDLKSAIQDYGVEVGAIRMLQVICEPRWNEYFEPVSEPVLSRHRRMRGVVPHCHGCKTISRFSHTSKLDIHTSIVSGAVVQDDTIRIYHYRGFPSKTEIRTGYVLPVEREEFDEIDNRPQALLERAKGEACNLNSPSIPGIMPQYTKTPERQTMVRIFTFSYRRLNYVCATINALKAQTLAGFVHHLHLLGYTREQAEFVRQVANGDERFVISELENLSQRENLLRILAEMPPDADSYIRMDDDDVYLPTYLQEMHKVVVETNSDLTAFTTLLRHNQRTGDSHLVRESGIYGMTMCLSRKAVEHLLTRPNWEHPGFEDSWMDRSMEMAGYKRHIAQTERPLVLYVQHATNVSCADLEPAGISPHTKPLSAEKTIFVRGNGGIGNQLFQLAYGLHLQQRFGCRLRGNLGLLAGLTGVSDEVVAAAPDPATPVIRTTDDESVARYLASPNCSAVELRGLFQCYGHFEGIRDRLMMLLGPVPKLDAIAIHIRRGDYLNSGHDMDLSASYYRSGVMSLLANYPSDCREIVVFSDDPQWCECEIAPVLTDLLPVRIFRGGDRDTLQEMKAMRGMVIPNSTFGWWGAWLADCPTIHPGEWRIPGGSFAPGLGCTLPYWHSLSSHTPGGDASLPTIISAFFDLGAFRKGHQGVRDAGHYRSWLRNFARIENPLVFFVDTEEDMHLVHDLRAANSQPTQVILVDRSLMLAFSQVERVRESIRAATFPTSPPNTTDAEYSCVQHAKYELVGHAIDSGLVASDHCCWMDCGVIFDHLGMKKETVYQLGQLPDAGDSIHYTQAGAFSPLSLREIQAANQGAGKYCHAGGFFYGSTRAMSDWCGKYLDHAMRYQEEGYVYTDQANLYAMLAEGLAHETKAHAFSEPWFGLCRHLLRPLREEGAS